MGSAVKRFHVVIRYRGLCWKLYAIATNHADLVSGLISEFGPGTLVSVRLMQ